MSTLTRSAGWRALQQHAAALPMDIAAMNRAPESRGRDFQVQAAGLYLDLSRQRATPETLQLLQALAAQQDLAGWIRRLFAGDPVNSTEGRAAFHMALRAPRTAVMKVASRNVVPDVHAVLARVCRFAEQVRSGRRKGCRGHHSE